MVPDQYQGFVTHKENHPHVDRTYKLFCGCKCFKKPLRIKQVKKRLSSVGCTGYVTLKRIFHMSSRTRHKQAVQLQPAKLMKSPLAEM